MMMMLIMIMIITDDDCVFQVPVLHEWLYEIYKNYNQVPFHNFKHCFMVAQMVSIWYLGIVS